MVRCAIASSCNTIRKTNLLRKKEKDSLRYRMKI